MKPFYIEDNLGGIVLNLDNLDKMFLFEQIYTFRFAFGVDADVDVRPADPSYARVAELYERLCKEGGAGTDKGTLKILEPGVRVLVHRLGDTFDLECGVILTDPLSGMYAQEDEIHVNLDCGLARWFAIAELEVIK